MVIVTIKRIINTKNPFSSKNFLSHGPNVYVVSPLNPCIINAVFKNIPPIYKIKSFFIQLILLYIISLLYSSII